MRYMLMVNRPAYGTKQSSSALLFEKSLIKNTNYYLDNVFFYCDEVLNVNGFISPANDKFHLINAWQELNSKFNVTLNVCTSAALRRGIINTIQNNIDHNMKIHFNNLKNGFKLTSLTSMAKLILKYDRLIQFL